MNHHTEGNEHEKKVAVKKASFDFSWIFWWQINADELKKQVHEYKTLKFSQSMRGISAILLWISVAATAAFVLFLGMDQSAFIDTAIFLVLSFFVAKGHRWALIASMLLWTFEKVYSLYTQIQLAGATDSGAAFIVPTIIWWTVYMHAFYLAFKVEQARRKA